MKGEALPKSMLQKIAISTALRGKFFILFVLIFRKWVLWQVRSLPCFWHKPHRACDSLKTCHYIGTIGKSFIVCPIYAVIGGFEGKHGVIIIFVSCRVGKGFLPDHKLYIMLRLAFVIEMVTPTGCFVNLQKGQNNRMQINSFEPIYTLLYYFFPLPWLKAAFL